MSNNALVLGPQFGAYYKTFTLRVALNKDLIYVATSYLQFSGGNLMKYILLIPIIILAGFVAHGSDAIQLYEKTHQELVRQIEQSKEDLKALTSESLDIFVIKNCDQYFKDSIIRVRIFEKPIEDYYWDVIVELKNVTPSNIKVKVNELFQVAQKEYLLQLNLRNNEYGAVKVAHSQVMHQRDFEDKTIAVEIKGKYLTTWVQLPSISDSPESSVKWMRTSALATANTQNSSSISIGIKSSIWSFIHTEKYYDQAAAGILELGVIEGTVTIDKNNQGPNGLILNIFNATSTRSYDIYSDLAFFYVLGASMSLDLISSNNVISFDFKTAGVLRLGVIFSDTVLLSLGSEAATNFGQKFYINPDINLTLQRNNISLSLTGEYTLNSGFNEDVYLLTPRWSAGLSVTIRL